MSIPRDSSGHIIPEEVDHHCTLCSGTGMSNSGPPDVGCCSSCGGTGVKRPKNDDYYDDYYDDFDYDYCYDDYDNHNLGYYG